MNYENIYFKAVEKFKKQEIAKGVYTEQHHIIPRYAGGSDSLDNLVVVTYRQHLFLHKVLYAWLRNPQDQAAVRLMTSVDGDKKAILSSMAGKIGGKKNKESGWIYELGKTFGPINGRRNVISGNLDLIRHLANNEIQRKKVSELGRYNVESGRILISLEAAWAANRGRKFTEEQRQAARERNLKRYSDPNELAKLREQQKLAIAKKDELGQQRSDSIVNSEIKVEEFLHKTSTRSKNIFVSPEGLEFESPIFAAKYYNSHEDAYIIESWCKNFKYGWKVIPKPAKN